MFQYCRFVLVVVLCLTVVSVFSQVQPYYQDVDLGKTGDDLYVELSTLVSSTHNGISYSQVWTLLQESDLDPDDPAFNDVLLVYGFDDLDNDAMNDRTRSKDDNCDFSGNCTGYWNREHVFPQSLANPPMSTSSTGTGTDGHNLRACDVQANSQRGNHQFAPGSDLYYPGDEWKGDVARIILYMYLRYQEECLPTNVGNDESTYDADIPDIFLEWNADDEVSTFEVQRNDAIFDAQGNRNPFIDNPYLATLIWGGPTAENLWPQNGSDITFDSTFSTPENIPYIDYTTTSNLTMSNSVEVGRFILRDGGENADTDSKTTTLTELSFDVSSYEMVDQAALFDDGVKISEVLVDQQDISFENLNLVANDGGSSNFSLRVSFADEVIDGSQFVFRIEEALADDMGTQFAFSNAGAAETETNGRDNRLNVIASALVFDVQPSAVNLQTYMTPNPVLNAVDMNGNLDSDFEGLVSLSTNSVFSNQSTFSENAIDGVTTFDALAFDLVGSGFNITASSDGISNSVESSTFDVMDAPVPMQVNEVFISEISDHPDFTLEFIELFNITSKQIDLTGGKLVILPDDTVWEFGISSGNVINSGIIPPRGFAVITRGASLAEYEAAYGPLNPNTVFIQGSQGMYFAPSSAREWELYQGGTQGVADGVLIDHSVGYGVPNNGRISKNLFTDEFEFTDSNSANPGELDDLIYTEGSWVNGIAPSLNTDTKNAYFFDDFSLSESIKIQKSGVKSDYVIHLNGHDLEVVDELRFESTSSSSAQLGNVTSGSIIGDVVVERFIPMRADQARAFRFMASPVGNVNVSESWQQHTHVTGAAGPVGQQSPDGFDFTSTGNPSMFTYQDAWSSIPNTNATALELGRGYRLYVRGDRGADLTDNFGLAIDVLLTAKGSLSVGNVMAPDVSNLPDAFSFVGNPYQAIVDLSELNYGSGIQSDYAYYWDPGLADQGAYVSIDLNSNTNSVIDGSIPSPASSEVDKYLQPGQAVFFQNDDSGMNYSIEFTENSKAVEQTSTQVFSIEETPYVNVRLYEQSKFAQGLQEQDAAGMRFYTNESDQYPQASKFGNISENLAFVENSELRSIYNTDLPEETTSYPLFIDQYQHEAYSLWIDIANFGEGVEVRLYDHYLDESILLGSTENIYHFNIDFSSPESIASGRFELILDRSTLGVDTVSDDEFSFYPNPAQTQVYFHLPQRFEDGIIRVYSLTGALVTKKTLDDLKPELDVSNFRSGVYLIEVRNDVDSFKGKLMIE